jgi:hypothetical protein
VRAAQERGSNSTERFSNGAECTQGLQSHELLVKSPELAYVINRKDEIRREPTTAGVSLIERLRMRRRYRDTIEVGKENRLKASGI